jgi:hypothetical protein
MERIAEESTGRLRIAVPPGEVAARENRAAPNTHPAERDVQRGYPRTRDQTTVPLTSTSSKGFFGLSVWMVSLPLNGPLAMSGFRVT